MLKIDLLQLVSTEPRLVGSEVGDLDVRVLVFE